MKPAGASEAAMRLDEQARRRVIEAVARAIIAHADELTALDQAIGDGDHGANMKRGFEAVLSNLEALAASPFPDALKSAGTQLVMKVGGASGPLYGTLFMTLGKSLPEDLNAEAFAKALETAIAAVKARGKSEIGQKTMLDVLVPVQKAIAESADPAAVVRRANEAAAATVPMKATRGRASFLGDRSIGHMDPGARSAAIIVDAAASAFGATS
jgi:phosphoenolpyruvate---glycerone phosphotransferase subunit DhaL